MSFLQKNMEVDLDCAGAAARRGKRMNIFDAIHGRRTVKQFLAEEVSNATLEKVLEAGVWAQNHKLTQPWRFRVLGAEVREVLAEEMEWAREKIEVPPVLVAVSQVLAKDEAVRKEDYAATACAIQNIALAAWGEGLGMLWSTGKHTRDARTAPVLGIDPEVEEIVGFLSLGYPAQAPAAGQRRPLGEVMIYLR